MINQFMKMKLQGKQDLLKGCYPISVLAQIDKPKPSKL